MKVKAIGPYHSYPGPVAAAGGASFGKNDLVQVNASGLVVKAPDAPTSGLAVALHKHPDTEYEGTRTLVQIMRLGEGCEVEVPFVNALAQADFGGGPFDYDLTGDAIDLDVTAAGCFVPLRVGRNTKVGDTSGFLIGYFTDAASFGS